MSEGSPPRVLLMPGGMQIPVPEGETATTAYWRHAVLSVAEGICPDHQVPLAPVPVWPGSGVAIGAHCPRCRRFWSLDHGQRVAWDLDHDPHRPETAELPSWVSRLDT